MKVFFLILIALACISYGLADADDSDYKYKKNPEEEKYKHEEEPKAQPKKVQPKEEPKVQPKKVHPPPKCACNKIKVQPPPKCTCNYNGPNCSFKNSKWTGKGKIWIHARCDSGYQYMSGGCETGGLTSLMDNYGGKDDKGYYHYCRGHYDEKWTINGWAWCCKW
jgi:hypothetical protein